MKQILLLIFIVIAVYSKSEDISGYWLTEKEKAIFEVYNDNGEFKGKIVWLDSSYTDQNNPDEKLRNRPILGLISLEKLKYSEKKKKWEKGKIYDSESGKTYSCEVTISKDLNLLYLRGYAGISLLGRTTTWVRIDKASFAMNSIGTKN